MTELENTLFIPLIIRANESKRKDALFIDAKAIEICKEKEIDINKYNGYF